uniref:Bulb-type lectin domain-containing protein n=1 Tax=Trieres chinensis TaxID=1514140 RepID=A0A7S2EXV5_TRICV|mmetsp:Transcript_6685/g.14011  ORF Transcript_6685/g.14011 Transcript_6685/m.14011 type:complete len:329 (+) Transcript_6685:92-1078(+)
MKAANSFIVLFVATSAAAQHLRPSTLSSNRKLEHRRLHDDNWECVGTVLKPGNALEENQYICAAEYDYEWNPPIYRFGLHDGRMVLFEPWGDQYWHEVWSSDNEGKGTKIYMQKGGKLVLRDKDMNTLWSLKDGCKKENSNLEFRENGVFMVAPDKKVKWFIDLEGNESNCDPKEEDFPDSLCETVLRWDANDDFCHILALQNENYHYNQVNFRVKNKDNGKFLVTDTDKYCWHCDADDEWAEIKPTDYVFSFSDSGFLKVNGEKTDYTCAFLAHSVENYAGPSYYWDFTALELREGGYCNRFALNLVKVALGYYEDDEGPWGCMSDC